MHTTLARKFGGRVRELRRLQGVSRADLAALIGVEEETVGRIERGETFSSAHIEPLAVALGVDERELFTFTMPATPRRTGPADQAAQLVRAARDPALVQKAIRILAILLK